MINLLFTVAGLAVTALGQAFILLILRWTSNMQLRRALQMLGLILPLTLAALFYFILLPAAFPLLNFGTLTQAAQHYCLGAGLSLVLLGLPLLISLLYNLARLALLYRRALFWTWDAPAGMQNLVKTAQTDPRVELRLWSDRRSYAYNLPSLRPGSQALVILSLGLVGKLNEEEISSVIQHEVAHLQRHDFWLIWLANWWQGAFFYLPLGRRFLKMLREEQEYACDQRAADAGGAEAGLALAEALLKVWEEVIQSEPGGVSIKSKSFEAPGLASAVNSSLTEQRINRLIERAQSAQVETGQPDYPRNWLWLYLSTCGGGWLIYLLTLVVLIEPSGCLGPLR